jgi:hypothetical protein
MFADALSRNRALKEDHANPWLALAQAGFGMMAGTSPHAGTNIGQGAVYGLSQYVSADRAAKDLAAKVDESRARLMEAQQYHQDAVDARNYRTGTMADIGTQRTQNALTIAQMRVAQQQAAALAREGKGHWQIVGTDPETGNALSVNSVTDEKRVEPYKVGLKPLDQARLDAQASAQSALQNYRNAILDGRVQTADELKRWHDYLVSKYATEDDIRFYTANRDLANKPTLTPEEAHQGVNKLRGLNAPGGTNAAPPAATPTLPMALPERSDALIKGGLYSTSRGPAIWDGVSQFMPVQ